MSYIDLQSTLGDWPYDSEQISVRKIVGADGDVKIQMRVELGVLQLECERRPDGANPYGSDSLLEFHRKRLAGFEERNGTQLGFILSPKHCEELREEASMFYRRFVCLFVLEEYDNVFRDTSHNLCIMDLCRDYASEPEDCQTLEVYRPYVLMMDARSRAHHSMNEGHFASALAHVNRGILHLRAFFESVSDGRFEDLSEESGEIHMLRELGKQVVRSMPEDSILVTRKALRAAVRDERFEEAARLRDVLKHLGHTRD